jgi:hypothetical protein
MLDARIDNALPRPAGGEMMNAQEGDNALITPSIDVPFPDLDRWAAAIRHSYVSTFVSDKAVRTPLQALTHGNEVCGAIALDWLLGGLPPQPRYVVGVLCQRRGVSALTAPNLRVALRR